MSISTTWKLVPQVQTCPVWMSFLGYWPALISRQAHSLLSSSFWLPSPLSFTYSALSFWFSFHLPLSVILPFLFDMWHSLLFVLVSCLTVSPFHHHHQAPWLCGNAHHHVWYQWPSLQPVTVIPGGELPSSLPGRPLDRSVCVTCVNTEGGALKRDRAWNGLLPLCCAFHLAVVKCSFWLPQGRCKIHPTCFVCFGWVSLVCVFCSGLLNGL